MGGFIVLELVSVVMMIVILMFIQCVNSPFSPLAKKWYSGSRLNLFNEKTAQDSIDASSSKNIQKRDTSQNLNANEKVDRYENFVKTHTDIITNNFSVSDSKVIICNKMALINFVSAFIVTDIKKVDILSEILKNYVPNSIYYFSYIKLPSNVKNIVIKYECLIGIFDDNFKNGYNDQQTLSIHSTEFQIGEFSVKSSIGDKIKFVYPISNPIVFTSLTSQVNKFGVVVIEQIKSDGFFAKYINSDHNQTANIKLDEIIYLSFTKGDYSLTIYKRFIVSSVIGSNQEKTRLPLDSSKDWTVITQVQHTDDGDKYLLSRLEKVGSEYYIILDSLTSSDSGMKLAIVGYIAIEISNEEFDNSVGEIDAYGLFYATFKTQELSSDGDYEISFSKTTNDLKSPSVVKVIKLNSIRNNLNIDNSNYVKFSPKHIFGNVEYKGINNHSNNVIKSIHQKCCILDNYGEKAWNMSVYNSNNSFSIIDYNSFFISGIYIEDYKQIVLKRLCLGIKPVKNSTFIDCYKKCKSTREVIHCPQTKTAFECLTNYIKPLCYISDQSTYIKMMNDMHIKGHTPFFKKSEVPISSGKGTKDLYKKTKNKPLPVIEEADNTADSPKHGPVANPNDSMVKRINIIECVTGEWDEWGNCSNICYDDKVNEQLGEFEPFIKNELFEYRIRRRPLYFKLPNAECATVEKGGCVGLKKCSDICVYRLNQLNEAIIFFWAEECNKLNLTLPTQSSTKVAHTKLLESLKKSNDNTVDYVCEFEEIWSKCDAPCIINDPSNKIRPLEYLISPNCLEIKSRNCTIKLDYCNEPLGESDVDKPINAKTNKPSIYLDRAIYKVGEGGWVNEKTNSCHCQFDQNEVVHVPNAEELYLSGPNKYLEFQTVEGIPREPRGFFTNMFQEYEQLDEIYPHNLDKSYTYLNSMASLSQGKFIEFPSALNKQAVYNMEEMSKSKLKNFCATGSALIRHIDENLLNINCDWIQPKTQLYMAANGKFVIDEDKYHTSETACKASCKLIFERCMEKIDIFDSMKIIGHCTREMIYNDNMDDLGGKCDFLRETNPSNLLREVIVHQSQDLCMNKKMSANQKYDPSFCQLICKTHYNTCLHQHKLNLHSKVRKCVLDTFNNSKTSEMTISLCEFKKLDGIVVRGGGLVFCKSTSVDCKYSEWSEWSNCEDAKIINGGGLKSRSRKIVSGGMNGGKPCLGTYENLNQREICKLDAEEYRYEAVILPSISNEKFKSKQVWDLDSEIKRFVTMEYEKLKNKEIKSRCDIFLGQRGIDEFRLIIDIGKCSCPQGFTPCTLPESMIQWNWMDKLIKKCVENPMAMILFKKSEFFDTEIGDSTNGTGESGKNANTGWTNISSYHFTCLTMTFVKHDYEALKLLCTASGETTFISCSRDQDWLNLQWNRLIISSMGLFAAGMFLGICLVSFMMIIKRRTE